MSRVLGQEGADPRKSGNFYKVVVQATFLLGAEIWVMSPNIERTQGGFLQRVARRLSNMHPSKDMPCRWFYLLMDKAIKKVEME